MDRGGSRLLGAGVMPEAPLLHHEPVPPSLMRRASEAQNAQDFQTSIPLWGQVIAYAPGNATGYYNRGRALHKVGRNAEAARDFERAIYLTSREPFEETQGPSAGATLWHNYAAALLLEHRDVAALAAIEKAIDLHPTNAEAHHCYAGILTTMNRDEQALKEFNTAHQLDPDRAETVIGIAMTLLRRSAGRDPEGWRLFETRRAKGITDLYPDMPLWRGQAAFPIAGRTIFVRSEQGYGDTLQFVRYIAPLLYAGAKVTLEVPRGLMRLFRRCLWPHEDLALYESKPGLPPMHDYQTALMTLPVAFPDFHERRALPYLDAAHDSLLETPEDNRFLPGFKVGLVWHGGARPNDPDADSIDKRRSLPQPDAMQLESELRLRCPVYSLQQEDLPPGSDFLDTARLVAQLDVVITVDSAVAHLAAAMGKPVWLLDRYSPCWRWGLGSATTHWYSTMTIYRQPVPGDWGPVIARVLADLDVLLDAPKDAA